MKGIFKPIRTDDLHDDMKACIGKEFIWFYAWVIEKGEYAGQRAMMTPDLTFPRGWVPECDIEYI